MQIFCQISNFRCQFSNTLMCQFNTLWILQFKSALSTLYYTKVVFHKFYMVRSWIPCLMSFLMYLTCKRFQPILCQYSTLLKEDCTKQVISSSVLVECKTAKLKYKTRAVSTVNFISVGWYGSPKNVFKNQKSIFWSKLV